VKLSGIDSAINVSCKRVGHNVWEAAYTPTRPGTYLLNVTWAGRLVKECPLKVVVEAPSNASRVVCSGEGLRAGTLGKEIKSTSTRGAPAKTSSQSSARDLRGRRRSQSSTTTETGVSRSSFDPRRAGVTA